MPIQPEPILDIVRGLSTIASFAIVVNQLKTLYDEFFISVCDRCRGTGCVTCPHCHGSKTLRRRPGFLRTRDMAIVDNPRDNYKCFYCGPSTAFDFNPMAQDEEEDALKIQDNLKAALANQWPRPNDSIALAGTVPCPECHGAPKVRRLTPDFGKALGLDEPWDMKVSRRVGAFQQMAARGFGRGREQQRQERRQFLEYPATEPTPNALPSQRKQQQQGPARPMPAAGGKQLKDGDDEFDFDPGFPSSFTLEEYIVNYASDDEEVKR